MLKLRHSRLVLMALSLTLLVTACSKKDSTSPAPVVTGPTFNFTFPVAGTTTVVGTQHIQTFTDVGTWNYRCIPHEGGGMTGSVVVDAASLNDSAYVQVGSGAGFSFSPQTVTIKVGGSVRWANVSGFTNHTVTRP